MVEVRGIKAESGSHSFGRSQCGMRSVQFLGAEVQAVSEPGPMAKLPGQ
jgi:hypothetical protein